MKGPWKVHGRLPEDRTREGLGSDEGRADEGVIGEGLGIECTHVVSLNDGQQLLSPIFAGAPS